MNLVDKNSNNENSSGSNSVVLNQTISYLIQEIERQNQVIVEMNKVIDLRNQKALKVLSLVYRILRFLKLPVSLVKRFFYDIKLVVNIDKDIKIHKDSGLIIENEVIIDGFNSNLDTILVVSHEASRSGAPVLSLNLVQALVRRNNVVVLLLDGGSLLDAFKLSGAAVIEVFNFKEPYFYNAFFQKLCEHLNFKYALINSIESRAVLHQLSNCFIPTISLIHEFSTYIRPREAFIHTFFWSNEVVFSAKVTKENAFADIPDLIDRVVHIFPQGRCLLTQDEFTEAQRQAESKRIRQLIRPKGLDENPIIVLGIGRVEFRKGVDLFIDCATRVVHSQDGNLYRFVWIGKGYEPDIDTGYSAFLSDQIQRAGIRDYIIFIDETSSIETAYEEADMLLLSSRLDPLPNVAIDAMAHSLPVLCFDKTTGIADFLADSGLRDYCVAEYLDSSDMANKIVALSCQKALRAEVSEKCHATSIAYFNMSDYVANLEALAKNAYDSTQLEKADTQTILESGLYRQDFSLLPHDLNQSIENRVRSYVRAWVSGVRRRKPFPGFHPGIYLEQHGVTIQGTDPFADYLRAGRPEGLWNYPVVVAPKTTPNELPNNRRVALHLHVFYPELLPEIINRLAYNRTNPDLFVSVTDDNALQLVISQLSKYMGKTIDIQIVPNRGRDIGPFLTVFSQRILTDYDYVGHIHSKKSVDVKDTPVVDSWREFLLENLIGGKSGPMVDVILSYMDNNSAIGMVFPDEPNIIGWGANEPFAKPIAAKMGLEKLPKYFIFPVGTMFWARSSALTPLLDLNLNWEDYPEEPLPYDGSMLHSIERLFGLVSSINNFQFATTNIVGLTR